MDISFRPMTLNDLTLISDWQSAPEVRQWYGKEYANKEQIKAHYLEELKEMPRLTYHYIIQLNGTDAGMIQVYLLSSYPEMYHYVQVGEGTAMVDIFLAPEFMHKGYGSGIMQNFLKKYIFSGNLFIVDKCAIGPEPKNIIMLMYCSVLTMLR